MERKIGEIFEYNGEWYQCVESDDCGECSFFTTECGSSTKSDLADKVFRLCSKARRSGNKHTIFKKLEKVGEPYTLEDKKFQKYKVFKTTYIYHKIDCSWQSFTDPYYVSLEIKQTKEDMEEKKLNLKPFNLEAAKAGKPVCTRDGKKARIICFDRIDNTGLDLPIVALIQCEETEILQLYREDGKRNVKVDLALDLMMLPEKKEGWANVYDDTPIYDTKEEALNRRPKIRGYIDTVKVSWEE